MIVQQLFSKADLSIINLMIYAFVVYEIETDLIEKVRG